MAVWVAEVASQRGEEAAEMTGGLHAEGEAQAKGEPTIKTGARVCATTLKHDTRSGCETSRGASKMSLKTSLAKSVVRFK